MFSLKIITTVMMSLHNNGILTKTNNHLFTRNLSPSFTGIKAVLALFSLLHTPSSSLFIFTSLFASSVWVLETELKL